MALPNRMSLRPDLLWLTLNLTLIIQCLSWNNIYIFFSILRSPKMFSRTPGVRRNPGWIPLLYIIWRVIRPLNLPCIWFRFLVDFSRTPNLFHYPKPFVNTRVDVRQIQRCTTRASSVKLGCILMCYVYRFIVLERVSWRQNDRSTPKEE
jgi:hypothetical protein